MKRLSFQIDGQSVLFSQPFMLDVDQKARLEFESTSKKKFVFTFILFDGADKNSETQSVKLVLSKSKDNPDLYRFRVDIPVPAVDTKVMANGQSGKPVTFSAGGLEFNMSFRLMGYESHWMIFPTITYRKDKQTHESQKTE